MKKLTNKQRCRNCIHKCVCPYQEYFKGVGDEIDRCRHYYSKERAYGKKVANESRTDKHTA